MRGFLLGLSLSCLMLASAVVALGVMAWGLVAVGLNGLVSPLLVLGLSSSPPLSIVAAERIARRSPRRAVACPLCGTPVAADVAPKPGPAWWD